MKIAIVTDYFPSSATPWQGHSAYQTLLQLAKLAEVHVFCALPEYLFGLAPKTALAGVDQSWKPTEIDTTYIRYPALPVISRPLNGFAIGTKVLPHVRAFRPDVILNYAVYPQGFAAVRVAQKLGIPCVLTAIGSDLNRISDALTGIATRYALRNAAFVTTVSRDLAQTAIALGSNPSNTLAILNGCDTSVFHPSDRLSARQQFGLNSDAKLVLYVGRIDVRKGLVELVEALAKLRKKQSSVQAIIVGDGPDDAVLRQRIQSCGVEGMIQRISAVPTNEVARYITASDVVTLPSYKEGCPNVVLEALSSGRPVVATDVGGIPELMDYRSGRLVPARDVPALTEALDQTLRREWNPEEIACRHQRSWSDVAADLFCVLQQVVARRL